MKFNYKIYLDDWRIPSLSWNDFRNPVYNEKDWIVAKNYDEFIELIVYKIKIENSFPYLISFDHDLADFDAPEEWTKILDFEDYSVSSKGRIRRDIINKGTSGGILKQSFNKKTGGMQVTLTKNGIHYVKLVHRLVAIAFIPNPENKPEVNHKDGIRHNNREENLEWMTGSENVKHSHEYLNRNYSAYGQNHKNSVIVSQYDLNHEYINTYGGVNEAGRQLNITITNIAKCARGERANAGGFIWKYDNRDVTIIEEIEKLPEKEYVFTPYEFKEKTGMEAAKWLVEYCMDNNLNLNNTGILGHSNNPSGKDNIVTLLNNFKKSTI